MKKRIVFDGRVITAHMHGIARYALDILDGLNTSPPENSEVIVILNKNERTQELKQKLIHPQIKTAFLNIPPYSIAEQFTLPLLLWRLKADLYHSPSYTSPYFCPCLRIITIHDMMHVSIISNLGTLKKLYYRIFVKKGIITASRVFTDSLFSESEIVNFLNKRPDNIVHLPLYLHSSLFRKIEKIPAYTSPRSQPYILNVTNKFPHKNTLKLVKAFNLLKQEADKNLELIIIGRVSKEVKSEIKKSRFQKEILLLGHISDNEMIALMKGALFFVFPSLYEGFGLPPLEACACGTPVLASQAASLPEVLKDGALLCDCTTKESLFVNMREFYKNKQLREEYAIRGKKVAQSYQDTRGDFHKHILKTYREVLF